MLRSSSRPVALALVAALVSVLAAVAFGFAPVSRPDVTWSWPTGPAPTAAAIPMLPYQPTSLTASVTCDAARVTRGVLLSTVPLAVDPAAEPLAGLAVASDGATVSVGTGGTPLTTVVLPPGPCALTVRSTIDATVAVLETPGVPGASAGGREVGRAEGDVRPAVAGAFTSAPSSVGLGLAVVGDTRFQTSPTPTKLAVGAVALAGFVVAVAGLARCDRRARPRTRRTRDARRPRGPGRPGLPDVLVAATLALWTVIGPITVDDGYIAGIVRSRGTDGQVGTVFRWLNSPESPFGWFYDVLHGVAALDPAPFWLRLPSSLLGLVAWALLTRAVLPRLRLTRAAPLGRRATGVLAAVVFLAWWLPFDLGVRPEPWVVVGATGVLVLVERAVARRAVVPVVLALLVAGTTLAVTPTGLIAFAPFVAAAVPLTRLVRERRGDVGLPLLVSGAVAALGVTLVLVFLDQTAASVLDSIGIRTLVGGDRPWTDEYVRYASLLTEGGVDGNLGKRAPVLALAAALLALAATRGRIPGLARGPVRRLVVVTVASLALLALTPTKWTHHFGAFAVLGAAASLVAVHAWSAQRTPAGADPARPARRAALGTAVAAVAAGLTLAGYNYWNWLSTYAIAWSTSAPQVGGVRLADAVLVAGALTALGLGAVAVRRAVAPPGSPEAPGGAWVLRIPPALVVAVVAFVVVTEVFSFARTAVARRDSYTLASDSLTSLTGRSCGVADRLRVEPDPAAGLLPALPGPPPTRTVESAGTPLAGWVGTTPWFAGDVGPAKDPLVVVVAGPRLGRGSLAVEFGRRVGPAVQTLRTEPLDEGATQFSESASVVAPAPRDLRIPRVVDGADAVRIVPATPVSGGSPAASGAAASVVSAPRVPRTVPWADVLPPGTPAAVDWPALFLFPCVPLPPLRDGVAALPGWRVSSDAGTVASAGYVSYTASQGGPWTTARALVRTVRYPVYLPGLELTDVAVLERWIPVQPLTTPSQSRRDVVEPGWATPGPLSIGQS